MDERKKTVRRRIIELLQEDDWTARDLSQELGLPEKEVLAHLPHAARSARADGKRLVIRPARCLACEYVFEARGRFTRPGRCPRCRRPRIASPLFHVE